MIRSSTSPHHGKAPRQGRKLSIINPALIFVIICLTTGTKKGLVPTNQPFLLDLLSYERVPNFLLEEHFPERIMLEWRG